MSIISGTFLKIKKADKSEFPRPSEVLAVSIDQNYTVTDLGNSEFQFITDSGDEYVIQGTDLDTLVAELEASSVESSGGSPEVVRTTWPTVDGNPGDFLQTNGSGITSWVTAGGGGSQDLQSVLNEGSSATLSGVGAAIFDLTVGSLTQTEFTVNANGIVVDDGDLSPLSPQGAGTINAVGLFVNGVAVGGTPNLQAVLNEGSTATLSGATFRVESNTTIDLDTSDSITLGDPSGQQLTINSSSSRVSILDSPNLYEWLVYNSSTQVLQIDSTGGNVFGGATGGAQGSGTINAVGLFVNGVAVGGASGIQDVLTEDPLIVFPAPTNSTPDVSQMIYSETVGGDQYAYGFFASGLSDGKGGFSPIGAMSLGKNARTYASNWSAPTNTPSNNIQGITIHDDRATITSMNSSSDYSVIALEGNAVTFITNSSASGLQNRISITDSTTEILGPSDSGGARFTSFTMIDNSFSFIARDSGGVTRSTLTISEFGASFEDDKATPTGITYSGNYDATLDANSLVPKRYANFLEMESYTVGTLPSASGTPRIIYVSDESGGAVIAFNDGTNWRRSTDRAIVS